jgi:type II secretory pathway pseudopilin PulG
MKKNSNSLAFTLVELIVSITIITLISAIIITNLTSSRTKANDVQRISDLNHIQLALNLYYDRCKEFPFATNDGQVDLTKSYCPVNSGTAYLSDYISAIPIPPAPSTKYDYVVNNATKPTDYVLHITLQNQNDMQKNSLTESLRGSTSYISWVIGFTCYNSAAGTPSLEFCLGSK